MNSGLLYYLAHRTMVCQKQISDYISYYGMKIAGVTVCTKESDFNAAMSNLLYFHPIVFTVGETEDTRPGCADIIFNTLNIPIKSDGEPKGILRLLGKNKTGYLIESINQAIVVLPDIPEEISLMLPNAFERLSLKFKITGNIPQKQKIPYEKLIEDVMDK